MAIRLLTATAAAIAALCATAASAVTYTFTVTSTVQIIPGDFSYIPNFVFNIDSTPAGVEDNGFFFTVFNVATTGFRPSLGSPGGDTQSNENYRFYTGTPGQTDAGFDDFGASHSYFSEQLFTGTTANPTFRLGTFALSYDNVGTDATLVISEAPAVPEPGTWALMLVGFGLTGLAVRRRTPGLAAA